MIPEYVLPVVLVVMLAEAEDMLANPLDVSRIQPICMLLSRSYKMGSIKFSVFTQGFYKCTRHCSI